MKNWGLFAGLLGAAVPVLAQDLDGIDVGPLIFFPEAAASAAYDTRAIPVTGGTYESDYYAELSAGASFRNRPAQIFFSGVGRYGVRWYSENEDALNNFYNLGAGLNSTESRLQWGLYADINRSLDYSTAYDPSSGGQPDPILTSQENTRFEAHGDISYDKKVTEKLSVVPGYALRYYYQEFEDIDLAEWVTHDASLIFRHQQSEKTSFTLSGYYTVQTREEEAGNIASISLGIERDVSEKTSWLAELGYAYADYELSGADQGMVSTIRGNWALTEKFYVYLFGGTDFVPGYDGGPAAWLYRLGYGATWQVVEKMVLNCSVLHDYQQDIGNRGEGGRYGDDPRLFGDASVGYLLTDEWTLSLAFQFVDDEAPVNQKLISINLGYAL